MAYIAIANLKTQPVVQPLQPPKIKALLARLVDATRHGFRFPLLAALLIVGSAWLFLGVLEDVATGDPLVDVDVIVHGALQKLRTPWMDTAMVAATQLGDVQVVLPVILAALAWFVWCRAWRTCLYWLAAVGVAEILVKLLKVALHRPRPSRFYDGVEGFAFPATASMRTSCKATRATRCVTRRRPRWGSATRATLALLCSQARRVDQATQWHPHTTDRRYAQP